MSESDLSPVEPSPLVAGFGKQLRALREHRQVSRESVGKRAGFSASTIGAFERGERIPDQRSACALDAALNAHQVLACVGEDLEKEQYPRKFDQLFRLEAEALSLSIYDTNVVNGLLQTEAYARALFETRVPHHGEGKATQLLAERLERQKLLARVPTPTLVFILDEAVVRRRTGSRAIMQAQLEWLLELGQLKHIHILVLPFDCEEPVGAIGPLTLLETPERRTLGYVEVQEQGTLLSDKETVSALRQRFDMIQVNALRPADSACLIRRRLEEL
ncbi:helix-turn-helix domain-containing protein [Streptomyces reniochalinae]|uniref:XRE family transcriptional regulator n=1 Tax=Streptomyces reniochalinae TaxID=2250578 RepID=A0A367EIJ8_9ACTN|nr:helix-turn-helix transcriptional regulator [Streptomyces reniochalinae]RCG17040.1 XRE family transcriptional regulator [Streptomyces reniochalinae]